MENDEFKAKDRWEDELLVVLEFDKDDEILFEIHDKDDQKDCNVFLNSDQVKELITNLEIALNKRQGAKLMNLYKVEFQERNQINGKLNDPMEITQSLDQFQHTLGLQSKGLGIVKSINLIEDNGNAVIFEEIKVKLVPDRDVPELTLRDSTDGDMLIASARFDDNNELAISIDSNSDPTGEAVCLLFDQVKQLNEHLSIAIANYKEEKIK